MIVSGNAKICLRCHEIQDYLASISQEVHVKIRPLPASNDVYVVRGVALEEFTTI